MKIISVRQGFASDHSSTSYEFLAIEQPLDKAARTAVSSLSSRANPTRHRVSFIYHADGYDIPGGWLPLMRDYYDVMYSESYDWWHLSLAFSLSPEKQDEIMKYSFEGIDDLGVDISFCGKRAIVSIFCRLKPFGPYYADEPWDYYDEEVEECMGADDVLQDEIIAEINDPLLQLLAEIRKQLVKGDYRALYEIWKFYGYPEDEAGEDENWPCPPVPKELATGRKILTELVDMLDNI